jgi:chitinase
VAFLELYEFDGLDLDWEYPSGESDKAGFAELLKELRLALGTKLISVAVAANSTIIDQGKVKFNFQQIVSFRLT